MLLRGIVLCSSWAAAGGFFEDDVLVVDHMCSQLWGAVSATGKDNDLSWDYNGIMVEEKTT